jgi:hypothetical protein
LDYDFVNGVNSAMENTKNHISVLELRRLLITLVDYRLPICFRYRMLGEMWQQHFFRVMNVTEKGVVLNDERRNKTIVVPDLGSVMQFELDGRVHNFEPHYHYDVTLKEVMS